jgi:hypothetical protein
LAKLEEETSDPMAMTLFKAASLPEGLVGDSADGPPIEVGGTEPNGLFAKGEDVGGAEGELVGAPAGGVALVSTGAE